MRTLGWCEVVSGLCIVSFFATTAPLLAQTSMASQPAGFYRIQLLGDSDTFVSLPLCRPDADAGLVTAIAGNQVTCQAVSAWNPNQFVYSAGVQTNTYYLFIASGNQEGRYYPILANDVTTLTLDLAGDNLNNLSVGDQVKIIPYWTLGTVFPGGQAIHASLNDFVRQTEVLIPNINGTGINLSASKTYYYLGGHWQQFGQVSAKDDDVLLPDTYFIVRHNVSGDTTLTAHGSVLVGKWRIPLNCPSTGKQDNLVAIPRPVGTTLNSCGLVESGAFNPSPNEFIRTDELLVFDNTQRRKNKSAAATYYYYGGHWERFGTVGDAGNDPVFVPGNGLIIRKGSGSGTVHWVNLPNY